MSSDYTKNNTDITDYIPASYLNQANTSLLRNLHNKFLTKEESTRVLGYVGDFTDDGKPYVPTADADRLINSLIPMVRATAGAEEHIFTFSDTLKKLELLGVDTAEFGKWGESKSFNFAPPITLDKFVNYTRYRWYGHLVASAAPVYNTSRSPEYYVIEKTGTSDWANENYWIHEDDAPSSFIARGYKFTIDDTKQALRPIIEYSAELENSMVLHLDSKSAPSASGQTTVDQRMAGFKTAFNQKPLFNLYLYNGDHAGVVSSIFYYAEGNSSPVDAVMKTRISTDSYGDYTFEHGLMSKDGKKILFYSTATGLKCIWSPGKVEVPKYYVTNQFGIAIETTPDKDTGGQGAWKHPSQMFHNITHENRKTIGYGDLVGHFISIISAQEGFTGNPFGGNNLRNLSSLDLGLGGKIKDYNSDFGLFLGLSNQPDTSVLSIIEFGKQQYAQLLNAADEFAAKNIADFINDGTIQHPAPTALNYEDTALTNMEKAFLSFVAARGDATVFGDTTSGIAGWPATIPYLGLCAPVKPLLYFDTILGANALRHHDGHVTSTTAISKNIEKAIALLPYTRSDGSTTTGTVSNTMPVSPYKNQFWFDTAANALKYFSVANDVAMQFPAKHGHTYYDRSSNVLYSFNSTEGRYTAEPSSAQLWAVVDVSAITTNFKYSVEARLYAECPSVPVKLDVNSIFAASPVKSAKLFSNEFAIFAAKHSIDISASDYDPANAFTWNYSKAVVPGLSNTYARWFTMYKAYFGTHRPNIEPWVLLGYASAPTWPASYTDSRGQWTPAMWAAIKANNVPGYPLRSSAVWNTSRKLGVNTITNALLPPYAAASVEAEAILNAIPSGISDGYEFGQMGPSELLYLTSADSAYDKLKVCYKLNPVSFVDTAWGSASVSVNGYTIDRQTHSKRSHRDIVLHGEAPPQKATGYSLQLITCSNTDTKWVLKCIAQGSVFSVTGDVSGRLAENCTANDQFTSSSIIFLLRDNASDFNIGDELVIDVATKTSAFVPARYAKYNGINQWFVNLNRYNSVDLSIALSNTVLRDWDLRLGYRMDGLIDTNLLAINSDRFGLHSGDYQVLIKENKNINSVWLNALRVQLIRKGTTAMVNGITVPANKGEDWVYRIETFNYHKPEIEFYEMVSIANGGKYLTFNAFEKSKSTDTWNQLKTRGNLVKAQTPFLVTGIENVVSVVYGYIERMQELGWRFNAGKTSTVDASTGRVINWQMFIERFIDTQYSGVAIGSGSILNPFANEISFATAHGYVSTTKTMQTLDIASSQAVFDSFGIPLQQKNMQIFRNDDVTEILTDVIIGGIHLLINEYEHVIVFNDYVLDQKRKKLIYDPFLGARVNRLHLSAEKQPHSNGRLSFGGHYIKGHEVGRNIEASVVDMLNYYDADAMLDNSQTARHARALLGYDQKSYMSDIAMSEKTQFGFWRGLVSNKGSNMSVDAFLNSSRFVSAKIDEVWAYKLAEFGDSRQLAFPELKLSTADARHNYTKLNFVSAANPAVDGFVNITSRDETRWVSIEDAQMQTAFEADKVHVITIPDVQFNKLYDVTTNGSLVISDRIFAYVLVIAIAAVDKTPFMKKLPSTAWEQINTTTVKFLPYQVSSAYIIAGNPNAPTMVLKCYSPSAAKFNPAKLIDYKNRVVVSDLALWDPARGMHDSAAMSIVDIISETDPAKYTDSIQVDGNVNYDPRHQWNDKNVGRVWWNTSRLDYVPYSDTKIFPALDVRLSYWGALADWSSVELYEWTESTVHPKDYKSLVKIQEGDSSIPVDQRASGTPAQHLVYSRTRTWNQRPIAWAFSTAPGTIEPSLSSIGEYSVKVSADATGAGVAILSAGDWFTTFSDLAIGTKLSAGEFFYNTTPGVGATDDRNFKLVSPIGEAQVTGTNQAIVIGSDLSFDSAVLDLPSTYYYDPAVL